MILASVISGPINSIQQQSDLIALDQVLSHVNGIFQLGSGQLDEPSLAKKEALALRRELKRLHSPQQLAKDIVVLEEIAERNFPHHSDDKLRIAIMGLNSIAHILNDINHVQNAPTIYAFIYDLLLAVHDIFENTSIKGPLKNAFSFH